MKKFKILLPAVLLLANLLYSQDNVQVDVKKITDTVYRITLTTNFSVNMAASIGPDGILLVDNGPAAADEPLKAKLKELSDKPVKYIINTHHHGDHRGANQLLGSDAKIIGHKNLRKRMNSGLNILQEETDATLPKIEFDESYSLDFNGEKITLTSYAGGHSDNDITVYFEKSNVVCLGSVVATNNFPFIGGQDGGSFANISSLVKKVIDTYPDDAVFIPGHGADFTKDYIKEYHKMLTATGDIVKKGLASGKTVEQLQEENVLKAWESYGTGFVTQNFWIQTIANSVNATAQLESIVVPMYYDMKDNGVDSAIKLYHKLKKDKPDGYNFQEFNLNLFGYNLLNKEKYEDAFKIFRLNIEMFPESANVYDSLGEAYERSGDNKKAAENYKKAVKNAEKTNDGNLEIFKTNLKRVSPEETE